MEILIGIILVIAGLVIFGKLKSKTPIAVSNTSKYYKKLLLSKQEQIAYHRITKALPEYVILAQVAFSQMIGTKGGDKSDRYSKFGKARQKVADFLVCDNAFNILVAIETDDNSHNKAKDLARDEILLEAGIPTIRWRVANLPSENDMRAEVFNTLSWSKSEEAIQVTKERIEPNITL